MLTQKQFKLEMHHENHHKYARTHPHTQTKPINYADKTCFFRADLKVVAVSKYLIPYNYITYNNVVS